MNLIEVTDLLNAEALPYKTKNCVMLGANNFVSRKFEGVLLDEKLNIGARMRIPLPVKMTGATKKKLPGVNTVGTSVVTTSIELEITEHDYIRLDATEDDLTLKERNFFQRYMVPSMIDIGDSQEFWMLRKMYTGCYNYIENNGLVASVRDVAKINTAFLERNIIQDKNVIMTTAAYEDLTCIPEVIKANERGNSEAADTGAVSSYRGIRWFSSNHLNVVAAEVKASVEATTFTTGKIKSNVAKDSKSYVIEINNATNGEVIKKYTILKTDQGSFVATEDATVAATEVSVKVERVGYSFVAGSDVTVVENVGYNFAFTSQAVIFAEAAPAVSAGAVVSVVTVDDRTGAKIRATYGYSVDSMDTSLTLDDYYGGRVALHDEIIRC